MSFLGLDGKTVAVFGVANKKSVGYQTGRVLAEAGAKVVYVAHTEARRAELSRLLGDAPCLVCDVEDPEQIRRVAGELAEHGPLHGLVHSIAFANYSEGFKPFHETGRQDFLQAMQISCHSLVELSNALKPHMAPDGAVVTISISTTTMAAENYGYMAPVKAALDSTVVFLAKSFSADTRIRFNAVAAGLLKTASSAGIPGYVDSYLFAEQATLRKQGLSTQEVANTAAFLLSPRASGINAQRVVVDAGMACNYFDAELVRAATRKS
ncbi:MAG: SDR family oxidoreductase [Myxococcales bacterium]|nr:SDR family oxidoreductase [Myxococcales bacterium]MCB9647369.1 SDR family oxidoreductase [Deltaproteobacteria bacterium]